MDSRKENQLILDLTQAMVGAVSQNLRRVTIEFRAATRVRLYFLIENESREDREEFEGIVLNLAASCEQALEVEVVVRVSSRPITERLPGRVVYGRKECEWRNRTAPVVEILSEWGVENPVRLVERRPFESWLGKASSWGGRLNGGRAVLIEVQDTWAEPWLEYGGPDVLDLREQADALVREVRRKADSPPSCIVPWLRVEHDSTHKILLWMRESHDDERLGVPSEATSPKPLLEWLQPVAEAVDWAKEAWSFGLCPSPEDLLWRGDRAAVSGWGKESFDRLATCRNGELRLRFDPEISAALHEKRAPLPNFGRLSPKADMSIPGFIALWLKLRLAKDQVWFEHQLDPLFEEERVVILRWLSSKLAPGGAVDFLRELGRSLA